MRLTGAGEAIQNGKAGDLYVRIHVQSHKIFKREGANLVMPLTVKLTDAILGAEYPVQTLDGEIKLKIPKGVSSGEVLRVKETGVPFNGKHRGDLLIKLEVKTPTKLSRKAEKIIEDYVQHWGSYYSVGYPIFLKWLINRFTKKIRRNEYISKKLRKSVLLIYKHKCNFCGATDKLEIDHIKPVSLGGLTELKNLQVLCKPCNIIKSNKF